MKHFSSQLASIEIDLVFREKASPLRRKDIAGFHNPETLSKYTVIADEKFNIGNAWYCKDPASRSIYRVSPEYGPQVQFVNSSMRAFKASLNAAATWSAQFDSSAIRRAPRLVDDLSNALLKLDPNAFESGEALWPILMEHMRIHASDSDEEMEFWFKLT
jgi:hypothetical protein